MKNHALLHDRDCFNEFTNEILDQYDTTKSAVLVETREMGCFWVLPSYDDDEFHAPNGFRTVDWEFAWYPDGRSLKNHSLDLIEFN